MRSELVTTIIAAVFGVFIAFFICNIFVGEIKPVSVKVIDSNVSTNLTDPNPEIFNYTALNPTVEVYVGSCAEYNDAGECIDQVTEDELNEIIDQDLVQALEESEKTTTDGNSTTNQDSTTDPNASTKQGNQ